MTASQDQAFHEPYFDYNDEITTLLETGDRDRAAERLQHYLAAAELRLLAANAAALPAATPGP